MRLSSFFTYSSSELSVRSTNPFDEDDNYDDGMSVSGMSVSSMPNRPYRKKRKAPLPPINSNKTDDDKSEASVSFQMKRGSKGAPVLF